MTINKEENDTQIEWMRVLPIHDIINKGGNTAHGTNVDMNRTNRREVLCQFHQEAPLPPSQSVAEGQTARAANQLNAFMRAHKHTHFPPPHRHYSPPTLRPLRHIDPITRVWLRRVLFWQRNARKWRRGAVVCEQWLSPFEISERRLKKTHAHEFDDRLPIL